MRADVDREDGELVAAEARHDVGFAEGLQQHLRDVTQEAIPLFVTEAVVDGLEVVHVEVDDGGVAQVAGGDLELLRGDGDEPAPIVQPGELVGEGQRLQLARLLHEQALGLDALGDVVDEGDAREDLAGFAAQWDGLRVERAPPAIDALLDAVALEGAFERGAERQRVARGDHLRDVFADDVRAQAEPPEDGVAAGDQEAQTVVEHEHARVGKGTEHDVEQYPPFFVGAFAAAFLGDVVDDHDARADAAVGLVQRHRVGSEVSVLGGVGGAVHHIHADGILTGEHAPERRRFVHDGRDAVGFAVAAFGNAGAIHVRSLRRGRRDHGGVRGIAEEHASIGLYDDDGLGDVVDDGSEQTSLGLDALVGTAPRDLVGRHLREVVEGLHVFGGELARVISEHAEHADHVPVARGDGHAGVRLNAERVVSEQRAQRRVVIRVGDEDGVLLGDHVLAERALDRQLAHAVDAGHALVVLALVVDDAEQRDGATEHSPREARETLELRLWRGVEQTEPAHRCEALGIGYTVLPVFEFGPFDARPVSRRRGYVGVRHGREHTSRWAGFYRSRRKSNEPTDFVMFPHPTTRRAFP